MVLLLVCLKTKSGLQNKQAGIDITMVEKYLYEVAAQTLDIADKKTLFDLFVRKIEVKQGNLSVDFKIKIYSTMVALKRTYPYYILAPALSMFYTKTHHFICEKNKLLQIYILYFILSLPCLYCYIIT